MVSKKRKKPASPFRSVTPGVVLPPESRLGFQRGISAVVEAVRPTLGPLPRLAAVSRAHASDAPELLDDGAVIARRITALGERDADMGAMFARHVLWRLHEDVGDGTVTAAVMLKTLVDEGMRVITAGADAMLLRGALEALLPPLLEELSSQSVRIQGKEQISQYVRSICPDAQLSELLGELFDVIGENGHLEIKNGRSQVSERQFIQGSFWESGLASPNQINDLRRRVAWLDNPAVLITDHEIDTAQKLLPVLQLALEAGFNSLAVLARKFSEDALALLVNVNRSGKLAAAGIKTPGAKLSDEFAALQDLSVLVGGRIVLAAAGDTLENLNAGDFGQARRVWADPDYFGVVSGKGDPLALRRHIAALEAALANSDSGEARGDLRTRIGRLNGGAGRLLVGGYSESEQKHRRELAERASLSLRSALKDGVLPGGGAAFLALRGMLDEEKTDGRIRTYQRSNSDTSMPNLHRKAETLEQRAARRMLAKALEAPARAIASNAGFRFSDPPAGMALDALSGQVCHMLQAGIMDAAGVLKSALAAAVHGAALALTVDVLVYHANPRVSTEP